MVTATITSSRASHLVLAVVKGSAVWSSNGQRFQLPASFEHIGQLLDGAARHGIRQLWCYDIPTVRSWASSTETGEWDVRPECAAPWVTAFRHGSNDEVDLIYPSLDGDMPWRTAQSAPELLNGLQLYRGVIGLDWRRSSGAMSVNLLRKVQSAHFNSTPIELQEALPPPARAAGIEGPARWIRRLLDAETRMRWIHSYDKNGAYLGACADLDVGAGKVRHVVPRGNGFLTEEDLRLPGYFLVEPVGYDGAIPVQYIGGRPGAQWVAAPTLKLLLQRGMPASSIREAYVWSERHQLLRNWYEVLRNGREMLMEDETPGAQLALYALKETYKAFNGWVASNRPDWDRTGDALYRPDVRDAIQATARCNLIRRAYKCAELDGITPLALGGVDGLYIVSDNPDPLQAAPPSITFGTSLKDFKPNPPVPMAAVRDVLMSDLPAAKRLGALVTAMSAIKHGGKGGAE